MNEKCTDSPRDCPLLPRVKALEEANKQHSDTHREIFRRLGDLESMTAVQDTQLKNIDEKLDEIKQNNKTILEKMEDIGTKTAVQTNGLEPLTKKMDALSEKVDALEAKPGKRWEGIVDKAIWAVCAAVIAFLLGRIGL